MNPENIAALALSFSVGGALITFGIMYGSLKKEQEGFRVNFKEFKEEIKGDIKAIRNELTRLTTKCHWHIADGNRDEE